MPHGVRVGVDGSLWIISFGSGTLDVVEPNGQLTPSSWVRGAGR